MENEILLRMNEDGVFEEYKEPFATIECPTEEDYRHLEEAVRYKEAHRWIPVSERLPDQKCFCLTTRKGDVYVEFWNGVIFSERNRCAQPTHWMPLPEPPMEG